MVTGLPLFRRHFQNFSENYMLIGGCACELTLMDDGGFRATKDIDILVLLETMNRSFAERFHDFILEGNYQCYISKGDEKKHFYRFLAPPGSIYPHQLELLSRSLFPDFPNISYTPLAQDRYVQSMSAIVLSDIYYHFARKHKVMRQELPCLDIEGLMVFKIAAYLNLRRQQTEAPALVRSTDLHKHRNDVFRLLGSISPGLTISELPNEIRQDLIAFIEVFQPEHLEWRAITKSLGIPETAAASLRKRFLNYFQLS